MAIVQRTIRLYALHARNERGPINYVEFFGWLTNLPVQSRLISINRELSIALEKIDRIENTFAFRFIAGNPGETPLIFDVNRGESVPGEASLERWPGSPTRVVIAADPQQRIVAIEGRRNGVTANNLEKYFSRIGKNHWGRLSFEITPLVSPSLVQEIDKFERIRVASVELSRPNFDWSDHRDNLNELAADSGAERAESSVKAATGESLRKDQGMVGLIKDIAQSPHSNIKDVRVTGRKPGDKSDSTVSLRKHHEKATAILQSSDSQLEQDRSLWVQGLDFIKRIGSHGAINAMGENAEIQK